MKPLSIIRNLVLPSAVDKALYKIAVRLSCSVHPLIRKNRSLQDRHAGKRCFILATGPSINNEDLVPLKDEFCIAVSNFFVHKDFATIRPKYYCIAPFHHPITEEKFHAWLKEIDHATSKETEFFFGLSDSQRTARNGLFEGKQRHFIKLCDDFANYTYSDLDFTHQLPAPRSVSIMALYAAINLGFKEIYLLGCDHNWNNTIDRAVHFYKEEKHVFKRLGDTEKDEWQDMETQLSTNGALFKQYKYIRQIANRRGIRIFNATNGSVLDVFELVSLRSVLSV